MKNPPRADRAPTATAPHDHPRKAEIPAAAGDSFAALAIDLVALAALMWVAAYCIFTLPYSHPPTTKPALYATSQEVGYNNRIALLTVLVVIGLLCLRSMFWPRTKPERLNGLFAAARPEGAAYAPMPRSLLLLVGAMNVALICAIYYCIPHLDEYGETLDWMPRLELALRFHLQPYRDILFNYGPLLFYIPLTFMKVGSWFGASMDLSYIVCYIGDVLLGLWLLFYVTDTLRIEKAYRMAIFGVLSASMLIWDLSFAIQGTAVRFIGPFAALLVVHRAAERWPPFQSLQTTWRFFAVNIACVLGVLSISPDMGMAYIVAQSAYFVHRTVFQGRRWLWAVALTVVGFPLFLLVFPAFLEGLTQFAKGSGDLPLFPVPFVLLYLFTLFWLVPTLLRHAATWQPGENSSLMMAMGLFVVATIPGAMGRADMGHIATFGLGTFFLIFAVLACLRSRLFPLYAISFLVVFGVVLAIQVVISYGPYLYPVQIVLMGKPVQPEPTTSPLVGPLKLEQYAHIAIPFGCDRATKNWLMDTNRYLPLYHSKPNQLRDGELPRLVKEVSKADAVIIPEFYLQFKNASDEQIENLKKSEMPQLEASLNYEAGMSNFFPAHYKVKYPPYNPYYIEGRYFASSYEPLRERADAIVGKEPIRFVVMVPKKPAADGAKPATESPSTNRQDPVPDPPQRPAEGGKD